VPVAWELPATDVSEPVPPGHPRGVPL